MYVHVHVDVGLIRGGKVGEMNGRVRRLIPSTLVGAWD